MLFAQGIIVLSILNVAIRTTLRMSRVSFLDRWLCDSTAFVELIVSSHAHLLPNLKPLEMLTFCLT